MFGIGTFGSYLFGTGIYLDLEAYSGLFSYNGYSFESDNITINAIDGIDDVLKTRLVTFATAREHGRGFTSWNMDSRTVSIKGKLRASSASELQELIIGIKRALMIPNKVLLYRMDNGNMVYTNASCTAIKIPREHYHINFVPYEFTFEVLEPFFYENVEQLASFTGRASSFTSSIDNLSGSFAAYPRVHVQFLSGLSSVTTITLTIGDDVIQTTGTFANGDIVIFDCKNKDVSKNSTPEQAYTGTFGRLEIGNNTVEVAINGTRAADIYFYRAPTHG